MSKQNKGFEKKPAVTTCFSPYLTYSALGVVALGMAYAYGRATTPTAAGESSSSLVSFFSHLNITVFGHSEKKAIIQPHVKGAFVVGAGALAAGVSAFTFWQTSPQEASKTLNNNYIGGSVTADRGSQVHVGNNYFGDNAGKQAARPK